MNGHHDRDTEYLRACLQEASASADPSTRVGAVLVDRRGGKIASGHNRFPTGVAETHDRLTDRETKLSLTVHAEMAAIIEAARQGSDPAGSILYLAALDRGGNILGLPPCVNCTIHCIEAGIREIVWPDAGQVPDRWRHEIDRSLALLDEAGVIFRKIPAIPVTGPSCLALGDPSP